MPDISAEFSEMRFRKSVKPENRSFTMNADMYRLFFALNENKTMSQVAFQQRMDLTLIMDSVSKLWTQGLIEPVGLTNLCMDRNFPNLLKINLHYIIGRKEIAHACVDNELKKLGLSQNQLPANRVPELVAEVAKRISDPGLSRNFRDFMETLIPLRAKMKDFMRAGGMQPANSVSNSSRGETRRIIEKIIVQRSGGNPILAKNIGAKLILKGINPDAYSDDTLDNPNTLKLLRLMATAMGVNLNTGLQPANSVSISSRGETRRIIEKIIVARSGGNPILAKNIAAKLMLKGINPDVYSFDTLDNPKTLERLHLMAEAMGVNLNEGHI
jgi:hypothetical protein